MIEFRKSASTRGIEKCHPAELPPEFYCLTNRWTGSVRGKLTIVYAGSLRHNPERGVLIMRTLPNDSKRIAGKQLPVASTHGALTILGSRDGRLLIGSADGGRFWFAIPGSLRIAA
jgi:hypothetical protein